MALGTSMRPATLSGIADTDRSGNSVSGAGDVNGDGLDDLIIGARNADGGGTGRGETYLVYGQLLPACDFDFDIECGLDDIELLFEQGNLVTGIPTVVATEKFDLVDDNSIDNADMTEWLRIAGAHNGYGGGDPNNSNAPYLRGDTNGLECQFGNPNCVRTVDITDFQNFLNGFTGSGVTWDVGNFNGDNDVDITDFSIHFLPNFFTTGGGTYGPGQAIPEPSTLLLLGLGGLVFGLKGDRPFVACR